MADARKWRTCGPQTEQVMVSDKLFLEQEKHDEHVSAYFEGSHDGSRRGPCRRVVGYGQGRWTILGAVPDEPRHSLGAVQDEHRLGAVQHTPGHESAAP